LAPWRGAFFKGGGDKMKKAFLVLLIATLLAYLSGCGGGAGNTPGPNDSTEIISKAVDRLSDAQSYELKTYRVEETSFGEKINTRKSESMTRAILDPYTVLSKSENLTARIDGEKSKSVFETYQTLKDNKLTLYIRYNNKNEEDAGNEEDDGSEGDAVLSDWEKQSDVTDKEQIDSMLRYNKNVILAELYLLKANITSFQSAADDDAESKGFLKFEGAIDPETVPEAYEKYLRESYIEMNFITGKENPSVEDLKNEIFEGRPEFQSGPTKLAFSETPVPVSLWIDKDSLNLKKVVLDETPVLQALTEKALKELQSDLTDPVVKKAEMTYEVISIDELDEIPPPESLKQ
jgi:hypothetical protein